MSLYGRLAMSLTPRVLQSARSVNNGTHHELTQDLTVSGFSGTVIQLQRYHSWKAFHRGAAVSRVSLQRYSELIAISGSGYSRRASLFPPSSTF